MQSKSIIFILLFGCLDIETILAQYHHHYQQQQQQYNNHGSSSSQSHLSSTPFTSFSVSSAYPLHHQYATPHQYSQYSQQKHHSYPNHYSNDQVNDPTGERRHHPRFSTSNLENDYETSGGGPTASIVAYPSSSLSSQMNPMINHHNPHSYLAPNRGHHYDQRESSYGGGSVDGRSSTQHYRELDKSASNVDYEQSDQPGYSDDQDAKETVGDLYHKKPTVESEYELLDQMASGDYPKPYGKVTSTEYKTGKLMKPPKKANYPPASYPPVHSKHSVYIASQTKTEFPKSEKPEMPSIEVPFLDKLIPPENMKGPDIKIPAIDINSILSNLLGEKGVPAISFHAPEAASNLLTTLIGKKPIVVNAPTVDILGSNSGNTRTKIQGFNLPAFLKTSSSLIQGHNIPIIDVSNFIPHFDVPKTKSVGKSPKISAILPIGPSIHVLRHIPFPTVPKMKLPDFHHINLNKLKIPSFDLTKVHKNILQKKDSMTTAEDSLKATYMAAPPSSMTGSITKNSIVGVPEPAYIVPPSPIAGKAITITKPQKIVTAYPLVKGPLSGHVVIEDYPFGRQQYGPHDDGGEPEIGCEELDKIIHNVNEPKPITSNNLYPTTATSKTRSLI